MSEDELFSDMEMLDEPDATYHIAPAVGSSSLSTMTIVKNRGNASATGVVTRVEDKTTTASTYVGQQQQQPANTQLVQATVHAEQGTYIQPKVPSTNIAATPPASMTLHTTALAQALQLKNLNNVTSQTQNKGTSLPPQSRPLITNHTANAVKATVPAKQTLPNNKQFRKAVPGGKNLQALKQQERSPVKVIKVPVKRPILHTGKTPKKNNIVKQNPQPQSLSTNVASKAPLQQKQLPLPVTNQVSSVKHLTVMPKANPSVAPAPVQQHTLQTKPRPQAIKPAKQMISVLKQPPTTHATQGVNVHAPRQLQHQTLMPQYTFTPPDANQVTFSGQYQQQMAVVNQQQIPRVLMQQHQQQPTLHQHILQQQPQQTQQVQQQIHHHQYQQLQQQPQVLPLYTQQHPQQLYQQHPMVTYAQHPLQNQPQQPLQQHLQQNQQQHLQQSQQPPSRQPNLPIYNPICENISDTAADDYDENTVYEVHTEPSPQYQPQEVCISMLTIKKNYIYLF